ncbi:MAG: zinc ABC transporter substrate-binding protein [Proteobacteria bacterium]|nr:zinc ABC transporter substrate-binding protein [Pseudomonadota bacterium]MDA1357745.1 zinc ABC transporter substrate-binding protein [Pseudomonadota bacterium]
MTIVIKFTVAVVLILGGLFKFVAAEAVEMNVVASIFPVHSLAAGVMEGVGEPALLLKDGLSPHDFSLRPSHARLLQSADLLLWVGKILEFPLARYAENMPPGRSLALGNGAKAGQNPHIWLDPQQAKGIVSAMAAKLRVLDPGHAAVYERNGATLEARIDALELELAALLQPLRGIPYVVFHDAYGPFESRFGLNNVGAVTAEPENRLSAGQVRRVRAIIADTGARCIFREPQFEPHLLAVIAEKSDIHIGQLDPLGWGLAPGINGYFLLLRNLAQNFVQCLSRP